MSTKGFLILLILVTAGMNTIAQVLLKFGAGRNLLNLFLLGGIVVYGLSTLVYIAVLSKFNLSIAYPLVIGLTMVTTTIASAFVLKEQVNSVNWMGIGLILSGICAIAFKAS
jgi:multidrug transporter EmrE-like cation transporter